MLWQNAPQRTAPRVFLADGDVGEELIGCRDSINPAAKLIIDKRLNDGKWPLYFFGTVGTGKTCAAVAIYMHWPEGPRIRDAGARPNGHCRRMPLEYPNAEPLFENVPELTRRIAFMRDRAMIYKRLRQANLLILDDIGRRKPSATQASLSPDQAEILTDIIESRGDRPTIYTSNWTPEQLPKALGDDRIASRVLRGMNTVQFTGIDRRLGGK